MIITSALLARSNFTHLFVNFKYLRGIIEIISRSALYLLVQSFGSQIVKMIGILFFVGVMAARDGCMPDRTIYRQGLSEKCEHLNITAITDVSHSNIKVFLFNFNSARLHVTTNW